MSRERANIILNEAGGESIAEQADRELRKGSPQIYLRGSTRQIHLPVTLVPGQPAKLRDRRTMKYRIIFAVRRQSSPSPTDC